MNEKLSPENKVLQVFAIFFEKALDILKSPFMKLLVVFIVTVLLALLLVKETISSALGFVLVVIVVLIFASITAALQYAEIRFRYAKRTEEQLKNALREVVMELQEAQRVKDASLSSKVYPEDR
jgi:hypothetical protein